MKIKRSGNSVREMGRLRLVKKAGSVSTSKVTYVKEIILDAESRKPNRYRTYAEFIHSYVEHLNSCNKSSQRVMNLYKTEKQKQKI